MFDHITMTRTPTGWQIHADGQDITEDTVGWHIEPTTTPNSPPKIWLAFLPDQLTLDSTWRDNPPH